MWVLYQLVIYNTSDARLKSPVSRIDNPLEKIKKLRGVYYHINNLAREKGFTNEKQQVALLAQDVERVLPEAVTTAPFDLGPGNQSLSGENYLTVWYEQIIPVLVEALKSQKEQLDAIGNFLKERNER